MGYSSSREVYETLINILWSEGSERHTFLRDGRYRLDWNGGQRVRLWKRGAERDAGTEHFQVSRFSEH